MPRVLRLNSESVPLAGFPGNTFCVWRARWILPGGLMSAQIIAEGPTASACVRAAESATGIQFAQWPQTPRVIHGIAVSYDLHEPTSITISLSAPVPDPVVVAAELSAKIRRRECTDCKGTGIYRGLLIEEPCKACSSETA